MNTHSKARVARRRSALGRRLLFPFLTALALTQTLARYLTALALTSTLAHYLTAFPRRAVRSMAPARRIALPRGRANLRRGCSWPVWM